MKIVSMAFGTYDRSLMSCGKIILNEIKALRIAVVGGVECGGWYWSGGEDSGCPWSRPLKTFRDRGDQIDVYNWQDVEKFEHQLDDFPSILFCFAEGNGVFGSLVAIIAHDESVIGVISCLEIDLNLRLIECGIETIELNTWPFAAQVFGMVFNRNYWLSQLFDSEINLSMSDFSPNARS